MLTPRASAPMGEAFKKKTPRRELHRKTVPMRDAAHS